jgi:hypothetical protein
VLLVNNVFISCCSGISIFGSKPGLLRHRKDKKRTTPLENQAFCAKFLEPGVSQYRAMKETNNKYSCCSRIITYFCAAQKSLLLFRAAHRNKQKCFDAFALLWDDTKSSNCPGRVGFAKARYMKSFSL